MNYTKINIPFFLESNILFFIRLNKFCFKIIRVKAVIAKLNFPKKKQISYIVITDQLMLIY